MPRKTPGKRAEVWKLKTSPELFNPVFAAKHESASEEIKKAYYEIDILYNQVCKILDDAGVPANIRLLYRSYAEKLYQIFSKFSGKSAENLSNAVTTLFYIYGCNEEILKEIAKLFGVEVKAVVGVNELSKLVDVYIKNPENGDVLTYDSNIGKWVNAPPPQPITAATFVVAASNSLHKDRADFICDGIDDQEEIQAAIDALPESGGTIILLEGTYNISAPINILKNNITLAGVGWATKIYIVNGSNCDAIVIGNGLTSLSNIVIRDLQIDGNGANQNYGVGLIYLYGGSGYEIKYCCIINCYLHSGSGDGLVLSYANNNIIIGNIILSNYSNGISTYHSNNNIIYLNQSNSNAFEGIAIMQYSNNNIINGNQSNSNGDCGIYLSYSSYNQIISNHATGNFCGIVINDANCNNNYIGKNYLKGNGTGGAIYNAGTGTYLGVPDTTNNNDNVT